MAANQPELKVWVIDFRTVDYETWLDWMVSGSNPDYDLLDQFYTHYFLDSAQGLALTHQSEPMGMLLAKKENPDQIIWLDVPGSETFPDLMGLLLSEYCNRTGLEAFALRLIDGYHPEESLRAFNRFLR